VRHLRLPRRGHCAARNAGWAASTGDALCFLDSDDLLLPEALAALEASLEAAPGAAVAYCRSQLINGDGTMNTPLWEIADAQGMVWEPFARGNFIRSPGCALIRRSALEKAGPWDTALKNNVDWDVWLRLAEASPFVRLDEPLFQYRLHGGNLSGDPHKMYPGALRMLRKHEARHRKDPGRRAVIARGIRELRDQGGQRFLTDAYRLHAHGRYREARAALRVVFHVRGEMFQDRGVFLLLLSTWRREFMSRLVPKAVLDRKRT
jgi:glycosyltransferase involved in cell wall biosynthesis